MNYNSVCTAELVPDQTLHYVLLLFANTYIRPRSLKDLHLIIQTTTDLIMKTRCGGRLEADPNEFYPFHSLFFLCSSQYELPCDTFPLSYSWSLRNMLLKKRNKRKEEEKNETQQFFNRFPSADLTFS